MNLSGPLGSQTGSWTQAACVDGEKPNHCPRIGLVYIVISVKSEITQLANRGSFWQLQNQEHEIHRLWTLLHLKCVNSYYIVKPDIKLDTSSQ